MWSLLLASGYLKAVRCEFNADLGRAEYELQLTNREVRSMFEGMIEGWFGRCRGVNNAFLKALLSDDLEGMNEYMNDISYEIFSFFDVGRNISERPEPERFYHGFVLGMLVELKDLYAITSNRESGFGRYDVMMLPKKAGADALIIEFKSVRTKRGETLEGAVQAALEQIEKKQYEGRGFPEGEDKEIWLCVSRERSADWKRGILAVLFGFLSS